LTVLRDAHWAWTSRSMSGQSWSIEGDCVRWVGHDLAAALGWPFRRPSTHVLARQQRLFRGGCGSHFMIETSYKKDTSWWLCVQWLFLTASAVMYDAAYSHGCLGAGGNAPAGFEHWSLGGMRLSMNPSTEPPQAPGSAVHTKSVRSLVENSLPNWAATVES
jgi:hypothetical protein